MKTSFLSEKFLSFFLGCIVPPLNLRGSYREQFTEKIFSLKFMRTLFYESYKKNFF